MGCKESKNNLQNFNYKQRKCTDRSWCCLFIAFWCVLIVIIVLAIKNGNISGIINGTDSFGNVCGQKNKKLFEQFPLSGTDTSSRPILLYFDFQKLDSVVRMCVDKCPTRSFYNKFEVFKYLEYTGSHICRYDLSLAKEVFLEITPLTRLGPCPCDVIKTMPMKNRCVSVKDYMDMHMYRLLNSESILQTFFLVTYSNLKFVGILCGFAFVISLMLLGLMFWLRKVVTWVICFLPIIINAAICAELWDAYTKIPPAPPAFKFGQTWKEDDESNTLNPHALDEFQVNIKIIYNSTILTLVVTILTICFTLAFIKDLNRLRLLFDEGVGCIKNLPGLCVAPMIALISLILFFVLSGYTLSSILTSSYPIIKPTEDDQHLEKVIYNDNYKDYEQVTYVESRRIRKTFWIYIVGFFWTTEFIFACEEFSISAAVAFWYFKTSIRSPALHSIGILFKHHFGTIAKGSAVVPLLKIPRLIITFLCKRLKKWFNQLQFIEECIGRINNSAYAPVAMEATEFSPSAAVAWEILAKNASEVESISNAFNFVLFLSKILVASLTCLVGIFLLKDITDLYFYMAPVLCCTFCAFCIAHVVFSIFEMTVNTLLLCVCEDRLINGGCGRSMKSNLWKLFKKIEDDASSIQVIRMKSIYRKPFQTVN